MFMIEPTSAARLTFHAGSSATSPGGYADGEAADCENR
jgi:hypothetical protein